MPLPSEQHQNTTSEYTPCKTDTRRGMIKHMHGCLGKAPPDRSLFNMSDYIIQHKLASYILYTMSDDSLDTPLNFPSSDIEYYSEEMENHTEHLKPLTIWAPDSLEIMKTHGYGPEDLVIDSEENSESEEESAEVERLEEGRFLGFSVDLVLM